jgi:hypothetical protein
VFVQVASYGLDLAALQQEVAEGQDRSEACASRLLLLPFGTDKEMLDEYKVRHGPHAAFDSGHLTVDWFVGIKGLRTQQSRQRLLPCAAFTRPGL